jgi:hypothetical protein
MSGTFNTLVRIRRQASLIHCSDVPSLAKRRPTLLWASGSISLPLFPVWLVGWRDPVCTAARWRSARQGRAALRIIDGVGKTRPRQPVLTGSLRQAHRGQRDHNRVRRAMSRRRRQFLGPFGSQLALQGKRPSKTPYLPSPIQRCRRRHSVKEASCLSIPAVEKPRYSITFRTMTSEPAHGRRD